MLTEQDKRAIKSVLVKIEKLESKRDAERDYLRHLLDLTKRQTGCTLEELGDILGVSRQRVHQILKGE